MTNAGPVLLKRVLGKDRTFKKVAFASCFFLLRGCCVVQTLCSICFTEIVDDDGCLPCQTPECPRKYHQKCFNDKYGDSALWKEDNTEEFCCPCCFYCHICFKKFANADWYGCGCCAAVFHKTCMKKNTQCTYCHRDCEENGYSEDLTVN